jgi:hypothetical protein
MPTTRPFPWWIYILVLVVILVIALAPLVSVIVASEIAAAHGCQLDEGSVHTCIVNGEDWGQTLYMMAMFAWLLIASLPIGVILGGIWLIILIMHLLIRYRARKDAMTP